MSTRFQFDRYARELDKPHRLNDVQLRRVVFICILLLVAVIAFAITASAQELPPGAPSAGMVLRLPVGSSGTGKQPQAVPTMRPASSINGRGRTGVADCSIQSPVFGVCTAERSVNPTRVHSSLLPLALTYAGLQAVDLFQTTTALNSGRYREANGAMSGIAGSPWKLGLVKGAVTSGSLLGIYAMRKSHPKASKWLLVGLAGAQGGIVLWNARQMR